MKKWLLRLSCVFMVLLFSLSLSACAQKEAPKPTANPTPTPAKVMEVRFISQMPVGNFITNLDQAFADKVQQRSGGLLKFTHFPAQQLYKATEMGDVLSAGGVEIADISWGKIFSKFPQGVYGDNMGMTMDWMVRFWFDSAHGGGFFYSNIRPEFAAGNVQAISVIPYGPANIIATKKQITKMADYVGLKLRASGKPQAAMVEAWGAKAVILASTETYEAIQRGTIDGVQTGATSLLDRKLYEVTNYFQAAPFGASFFGLAANMDFWKGITAEQRKIIEEEAKALEIACTAESIKQDETATQALINEKKMPYFVFPTAEMKKLEDTGIASLKDVLLPLVGEASWNKAMSCIAATRDVNLTWRQVLEARQP